MSKIKRNGIKPQVLSIREAVEHIADQDTVAVSGADGGVVDSYAPINALHERYVGAGCPKSLTLWHSTGLGDRSDRDVSPLALEDLVKRVIGGHWGQSPRSTEMANENRVEAHSFPQSIMAQLTRAAATGQPGILSHVGLGAFTDPRVGDGKLDEVSQEDLVRVMNVDGKEWLHYLVAPLDVCLVRATTTDTEGYASIEGETTRINVLRLIQAVRNSGGTVILQVKRLVKTGTLHPKSVRIPGFLVDVIIMEEKQGRLYNGSGRFFSGDYIADDSVVTTLPLDQRRVVVRRALMEVCPGYVGNVGVGIAGGIGNAAREESIQDAFTLTMGIGPVGGATAQGIFSDATVNTRAVMDMPAQFDFYDGGGLGVAFSSLAKLDKSGDANVHHFNDKIMGTGDFVSIVTGSKKVVLCGTLCADKLLTEIRDGKITIQQEDRSGELIKNVSSATFSAKQAEKQKQEAIYTTERVVFKLMNGRVVLTEIVPGIDVQKDVIDQMGFAPETAEDLKEMGARIFREEKMNIYNEFINQ